MSQLVNAEVDRGNAVLVSDFSLFVVLKIENKCTGINDQE